MNQTLTQQNMPSQEQLILTNDRSTLNVAQQDVEMYEDIDRFINSPKNEISEDYDDCPDNDLLKVAYEDARLPGLYDEDFSLTVGERRSSIKSIEQTDNLYDHHGPHFNLNIGQG